MGMLTLHLLLLLLLLGSSNAQEEEEEFKIELDRCSNDTACFVRGSCIVGKAGPGLARELVQYTRNSSIGTLNDNCDVILQTRSADTTAFYLMIQIKSDSEAIKNVVFSIEMGERNDDVKCAQHDDYDDEDEEDKEERYDRQVYRTVKVGTQIHEEKLVFCAFVISIRDDYKKKFYSRFTDSLPPSIQFETATKELIIYRESRPYQFYYMAWDLFPCKASTSTKIDGDILLTKAEITPLTIACANGQLRLVTRSGVTIYPKKIECVVPERADVYDDYDKDDGGGDDDELQYKIKRSPAKIDPGTEWIYDDATTHRNNISAEIPGPDAYCEEKFCSLCSPLIVDNHTCIGCTQPTATERGGCKVAECPDNKWRRDGGVHVGTVECRQNAANAIESAWFYAGSNDKVVNGGCSDKFDCAVFSNLDLKAGVTTNEITLTCSDPSYLLKTSQGTSSTSFVCDDSDGLYKDGGKTVQKGESISCVKYCSICTDIYVDVNNCIGCTSPVNSAKDDCKVAECPDKKWRRDGGVHEGTVECRKDAANAVEAAWFYSGSNEKVVNGGCSVMFDCAVFSNLDLKAGATSDGVTLTCSDPSYFLKTSQGISSTSFVCDDSDGLFKDGEKSALKGESISCVKYCSLCTDFSVAINSCVDCTQPTTTERNDCKFAECPNNKWRKEGKVIDGAMECRKDPTNLIGGAWFWSGSSKIPNIEGCSEKLDCAQYSGLQIGVGVIPNPNTIRCPDGPYHIETSQGLSSAKFDCDDSDGLYKDGSKTVPKGETINCRKLTCAEYYNLDTGVISSPNSIRCPDGPYLIETSQGISSTSFVCDESTGLYKTGEKIVPKGEKLSCRKLDCTEYSGLTLGEGVKSNGMNLSCSDYSFVIKTSQGISSTSFVCDESTGLFKDGEKIVQKGEKLTCEKSTPRADANVGSSTLTFALSGVFGVILIVGIILALVCYMRRKKQVEPPKEKKPEPAVEAVKSKEAPSPAAPTTPVSGGEATSPAAPTTPVSGGAPSATK